MERGGHWQAPRVVCFLLCLMTIPERPALADEYLSVLILNASSDEKAGRLVAKILDEDGFEVTKIVQLPPEKRRRTSVVWCASYLLDTEPCAFLVRAILSQGMQPRTLRERREQEYQFMVLVGDDFSQSLRQDSAPPKMAVEVKKKTPKKPLVLKNDFSLMPRVFLFDWATIGYLVQCSPFEICPESLASPKGYRYEKLASGSQWIGAYGLGFRYLLLGTRTPGKGEGGGGVDVRFFRAREVASDMWVLSAAFGAGGLRNGRGGYVHWRLGVPILRAAEETLYGIGSGVGIESPVWISGSWTLRWSVDFSYSGFVEDDLVGHSIIFTLGFGPGYSL